MHKNRPKPPCAGAPQHPRRWRAFTLVEVMIAMTILIVVLSAIYSSWTAILRSRKVGMDAAVEAQHTRMAMRTIVDALLCMQMFAGNQKDYSFETESQNDFSYLSFVARLPASFLGSGLYSNQVVRRVTFTVEASGQGENQLRLYQQPLLEEPPLEQKANWLALANNVSTFSVEFWDAKAKDWATEWLYTNQLPKLVRVSLGFGKAGRYQTDPDTLVTREVALPAMVVPREYQMAALPGVSTNRTGGLNRAGTGAQTGTRGASGGIGRESGGSRLGGGGN